MYEKEYIEKLMEDLFMLKAVHETGETYYNKTKIWNQKDYGWHNPLFPPEYRRCCLNEKKFQMNASCDLYYLMACYYEKITGRKAPNNFETNRLWKDYIVQHTSDWLPGYQTAWIHLIEDCTRWQDKYRIQNAMELLDTKEIKMLNS